MQNNVILFRAHIGNFNFAIWRQRDKEMFFLSKKIANLKKM